MAPVIIIIIINNYSDVIIYVIHSVTFFSDNQLAGLSVATPLRYKPGEIKKKSYYIQNYNHEVFNVTYLQILDKINTWTFKCIYL